jgi:hypothetical protein
MRRAKIEQQNQYLLDQQRRFRVAADIVADAWMTFPEVHAVAVIGSVAKALWKEVPRFSDFRRQGIEVWHECRDLDLALWLESQQRLHEIHRAANRALSKAFTSVPTPALSPISSISSCSIRETTPIWADSARSTNVRRENAIASFRVAAQSRSTRWSTVSCRAPISWRRLSTRCSIGAASDDCGQHLICRLWSLTQRWLATEKARRRRERLQVAPVRRVTAYFSAFASFGSQGFVSFGSQGAAR